MRAQNLARFFYDAGGAVSGRRVIAIDGPAGAGKTSVARGAAARLGWEHLDTGAYYRAATLAALVRGADLDNEAETLAAAAAVEIGYRNGAALVAGINVEEAIRGESVTAAVSKVAAMAGVRRLLTARQRQWLDDNGGRGVVEGRDIGTAVFPDAALKVYLTASPQVRAARRAGETGREVGEVRAGLERRDRLDSTREASPLQADPESVVIDTTDLSPPESVEQVMRLAKARGIG